MTTEKQLRDELLKQNGVGTQKAEELRDRILAKDEAQVRRMKWVAGIAWVVFLISFLLAALLEFARRHPILGLRTDEAMALFPEYSWFVPMAIIITQGLFILAVAMTFSLHVRSRTLTMHQIQTRLAGIEEQLRKMAQKD
jgi:hypothetical protein